MTISVWAHRKMRMSERSLAGGGRGRPREPEELRWAAGWTRDRSKLNIYMSVCI